MIVPENLRWLEGHDQGRAWLASLDQQVAHAVARWGLEVGPVFDGAYVSYTCPATTAGGTEVVLKVQYPHEECRTEAAALAAWNGRGAIQLLEHDAPRWTLLLERCRPGTELARAGVALPDAIDIMADLTEQSWVAPPPGRAFATSQGQAHGWIAALAAAEAGDGPFPRARLDLAAGCLREVADDQGEQVIVNQDLHDQNVLASGRLPWLVIDPKAVVGERHLSLAPILRSFGYRFGPEAAVAAFDRLCSRWLLDPARVLRWTIGQSVCWGLDSSAVIQPRHAATVDRLVDRLHAVG